ncbi:MAG TPA: M23 family metallopeptidase [Candidatus Paceibacterota bacterium]|jgi:murein DD-endopeptidase MepM/ murein hydrolase activator NlpD|nr:M23 family metallopeptidase [Candidatus Paceibacterota bacterium]
MGKVIGWVCLIFFGLVFVNYVSTALGSFFAGGGLAHAQLADISSSGSTYYDDLPSINFNFFSPSGAGKDYITQGYGHTSLSSLYIDGWHNGVDIAASYGTPIYSPATGTVLATGDQDDYCPHIAFGKFVVVDDTVNHLVLMFAHLGNISVSPGAAVTKGALLGTVGSTGDETGPHLHFSIFQEQGFSTAPAHGCGPYPQGHDVDPLNYLGTTYQ